MSDPVNHPSHYTSGKYETIDIIEDIVQHYTDPVDIGLVWQTIKYIARAPLKGNYQQDLKKAHFYLTRLVHRFGYVDPSDSLAKEVAILRDENTYLHNLIANNATGYWVDEELANVDKYGTRSE